MVILKKIMKSSGLLEYGSGNSYKNAGLYGDTLVYCADLPVLQLGCRKLKAIFKDTSPPKTGLKVLYLAH